MSSSSANQLAQVTAATPGTAAGPAPAGPGQAARASLQLFLHKVVERCQQSWHVTNHLGFLPRTSITHKFKYNQAAREHPEIAAKLSVKQVRALELRAAIASGACTPDVSGVRPRPKRARDAFGPGMVFVVNTALAWLMFSIDVRNSMLR